MIAKSLKYVIIALALLYCVNCEVKTTIFNTTTYVICNPEKASSSSSSSENTNECPKDSQCIDIKGFGNHTINSTSKDKEGLCSCKPEFMVNRRFSAADNTSVYCIKKEENSTTTTTTTTTTAQPPPPTSTSTKAPVATTTTTVKPAVVTTEKTTVAPKKDNSSEKHEDPSKEKITPAPEPQKSFFGALLVPIMVVFAFIAAVFAVRKYDVLDRAHTYIRNRRGQQHQTRYDGLENDFDDDPLLI